MGLDVELIRLEGSDAGPPRRDHQVAVVADTRGRFAASLERARNGAPTPLLERIDPYGVTELDPADMAQFLRDIDAITDSADPAERDVLQAVRRLAESCQSDGALRLRCVGD